MHQFECIHPYNACKQFDSGLLQKVGVLIVESIYQAKKPVGDYIAKGDKYYLDGFHKDHIEVLIAKEESKLS